MTTAVLVTRHADHRDTPHALVLSDVVASGEARLRPLRAALIDLQARSHVVQVESASPSSSGRSLVARRGHLG